jgi:hypothetical protein
LRDFGRTKGPKDPNGTFPSMPMIGMASGTGIGYAPGLAVALGATLLARQNYVGGHPALLGLVAL